MSASAERAWLKGQHYLAAGQLTAARISFETLLQRDPRHGSARVLLAGIVLAEGRVREASAQLLEATRYIQSDANAIAALAQALLRVGELVAARRVLGHPEISRTRDGAALAVIAHVRQLLGEHEESLALMERAQALGFEPPEFRYFHAVQLQFNGRIDEAKAELDRCVAFAPALGRAVLTLARLRKQTPTSNLLAHIEAQRPHVALDSEDQAALEFAAFKAHDDLGQLDDAWRALARGNAIMAARNPYDATGERALYDRIARVCDRVFLQERASTHEGPTPIFVIGLPRSGTTVLERILGNHSNVTSAGELGDFGRQLRWEADAHGRTLIDETILARASSLDFARLGRRYLDQTQWRAQGRAFYVDKLPPNYLLAGLIARALPNAPILHMVREPMDVCFSNYKALFGDAYPYSYDLAGLAAHYANYRRLMAHWHEAMPGRILDVDYATLVANPESGARRILAHCGLDYEAACVAVENNRAPSATLSSAQVREPIHARALGEWRRYETQLAPLHEALGALVG